MKPADQPTKAEPPRWMPTRGTALKIAGWYAVLGALWIFFSIGFSKVITRGIDIAEKN